MTRLQRRRRVIATVLAAIIAVLLMHMILFRTQKDLIKGYKEIEYGMAPEEVWRCMGAPPGSHCSVFKYPIGQGRELSPPACRREVWEDDRYYVRIDYDQQDRVCMTCAQYNPERSSLTPLGKILWRLGFFRG